MSENKGNYSIWIGLVMFAVLMGLGLLLNVSEYGKRNKLKAEGRRMVCAIDSLVDKGSKKQVFLKFEVDGKLYTSSGKVKAQVVRGDSLPVYYLPEDPSVNTIAQE